ncbi:hypothetical protein B0H34DRAFT_670583 [Crassisporium funariophilum]|nr:hypothetical protein B0H34DRAFT_670583 [Crassisporium funariophilum]
MQQAVISQKEDTISAQVGAEMNRQKKKKLEAKAMAHCELIDDGGFWHWLKSIVNDLELICLGLNLNQPDVMRADQTFAGIVLNFQKHPNHGVAAGMTKRVEKRWKALYQPINVQTYCCVCYCPPEVPQTEDQERKHKISCQKKKNEVLEAFLSYLSLKGAFEDWEKNKEMFQHAWRQPSCHVEGLSANTTDI